MGDRVDIDKRLVQTAVVGAAESKDPVIMPMTRFEAQHFLGEYPGADFWCGTWLGGCGRKLTTRVGMERIPHFAHRPVREDRTAICHRRYNDRRSADHLFVNRDLAAWARRRGHRPDEPVLHGDFRSGGTCTCLDLTLRHVADAEDGLITVVFKTYNMSVWYSGDLDQELVTSWRSWVFGPGVASPQTLLDRDGFALHLRLDSTDAVGRIEIGTRPPRGGIEWAGLDDCTVDERGLCTPFVADLRRKRTVLPVAPVAPAVPVAPVPPTPPVGVRVAPGAVVSPLTFRRAVLRVGREYGIGGDAERAGVCARLGRTTDHASPQLPPWLWADVRRLLDIRAPAAPSQHARLRRTGSDENAATPSLIDLDERLDDIPLDERLVDFFAETGCTVYDDQARLRWLRVASVHSSYLYENGGTAHVGQSVLRGLSELAKRHVREAVLDRYVKDHQPDKVGQQSVAFADHERSAWEALNDLPVLDGAMRFGKGEAALAEERRSKSRREVVQQIVGLASLFGGHPAVRRLVDRAVSSTRSTSTPEPLFDWRASLDRLVPVSEQRWEWNRTGPDHEPRFAARITDKRGRSAEGAGPSKKAASRTAVEAFVGRWLPSIQFSGDTQNGAVTRRPSVPRTYGQSPPAHSAAVATLITLFGLPGEASAYVARALTHSSWVYENQREVQLAHQRDNSLLAHHGSVVADLLVTDHLVRAVLSRTAKPDRGELIMLTPEEKIWRGLFARLRLEPGLLLGAGQRSNPEPAYAGAMQALLAVAWRFRGSALLSAPPAFLADWVRANEPIQDAATRLQRICAMFDVELQFDYEKRGKDHLTEFASTCLLRMERTQVTVAGSWSKGDKAFARKRCAERVLAVLLTITHSEPWDLAAGSKRIAAFLLRAQLNNASRIPGQDLEWCDLQGHLGTSFVLAGDRDAYDAWSQQVGELIGDRPTETDPRLADFYHRVVEIAR